MLRSRKGIYKGNKIKKDIEQTVDPLQPTPEPEALTKARKEDPDNEDIAKVIVPTLNVKIPTPQVPSSSTKAENCLIFNDEDIEDTESYIRCNENVIFLSEDNISDTSIKKAIYNERLKNNKMIFNLYDQVKIDNTDIKYTYIDINKYKGKNLYVDLFYYNETYFKNA